MDLALQLLLMISLGLWGGQWLATHFGEPLWGLGGLTFGLAACFWCIIAKARSLK